MTDIGHNSGEGFAALQTAAEALVEKCERLAKLDVTDDNASDLRTAAGEEPKLRKKLNDEKGVEKRPHLDANEEIEARYKRVLAKISTAAAAINKKLTDFVLAKEAAQKAEAERVRKEAAEKQRIADEAAKAAAAAAAPDPFEAFDAAEAAKEAEAAQARAAEAERTASSRVAIVGGSGVRATSLKSFWSAEITDAALMVAHFADQPSVIEAALKLANAKMRETNGAAKIPGCKAHEDRRVA